MKRFLALYDVHWGYENANGNLKPFHDARAIAATLKFASDFQPDTVILGGDILDCGSVSHHNRGKKRSIEGLRLTRDAAELRRHLLSPLENITADRRYIIGNHEDWLNDLIEEQPALEGVVEVEQLLSLKEHSWKVIPQGGQTHLGKLWFIHGDTIKGGGFPAKKAVLEYERNIRLGHYHTLDAFTKTSAIDVTDVKTGMVVPGLCNKNPRYLEGKPNRWLTGFLYGYIHKDGSFNDYVTVITDGKFTAEGKRYVG